MGNILKLSDTKFLCKMSQSGNCLASPPELRGSWRISPSAEGEEGAEPLHPAAFEKAGETFKFDAVNLLLFRKILVASDWVLWGLPVRLIIDGGQKFFRFPFCTFSFIIIFRQKKRRFQRFLKTSLFVNVGNSPLIGISPVHLLLYFRKVLLVFQYPACCLRLRKKSPPKKSRTLRNDIRIEILVFQFPKTSITSRNRISKRAKYFTLTGRIKNTIT